MLYCPACGTPAVDGANACTQCGSRLPTRAGGVGARTAVIASVVVPPQPPRAHTEASSQQAPPLVARQGAATMLGVAIPAGAMSAVAPPPAARQGAATMLGVAIPAGAMSPAAARPAARRGAATQLGMAAPAGLLSAAAAPAAAMMHGVSGAVAASPHPSTRNRTVMGVAMPGIAPTHENPPPAAKELGATMDPRQDGGRWQPGSRGRVEPVVDVRAALPRSPRPKPKAVATNGAGRSTLVMAVAGALALFAVAFGFFWRSAPPLSVRAQLNAEGREVLHVQCPSCADGTELRLRGAVAKVTAAEADLPLTTPLLVGQNKLAIAVDRPGGGRDETVEAEVEVAYRIRPDLATLGGERPVIQIVVQAAPGVRIALDGHELVMTGSQAIHSIDVSAECTGASSEPATLRRHVQYTVTPKNGHPETGTLDISVGIVQLQVDAPGAHAVTEGQSFMLAGRTLQGAEIMVSGHPIAVQADGLFSQSMSVSTIGSTQIYVRAQKAAMAPRLMPIAVKRVVSLAAEAVEFKKQPLADPASVIADPAAHLGKPIVVSGSVLDARVSNHQTVILLEVARGASCTTAPGAVDRCRVRLVHGADNPVKRGEEMTAFGTVARTFAPVGAPNSANLVEIQVDFTQKGKP